MSKLYENTYHCLLHDIKDLVIDFEKIKSNEKMLEEKINELIFKQDNLKNLLEDVMDTYHNRFKIPHRCPICDGSTLDDNGELCHPCNGKGIVWG